MLKNKSRLKACNFLKLIQPFAFRQNLQKKSERNSKCLPQQSANQFIVNMDLLSFQWKEKYASCLSTKTWLYAVKKNTKTTCSFLFAMQQTAMKRMVADVI